MIILYLFTLTPSLPLPLSPYRSFSSLLLLSPLAVGIGSYASWDEPARIKWLIEELEGKRPLIRTSDIGKTDPTPLFPHLLIQSQCICLPP